LGTVPKRCRSAYTCFVDEKRQELRNANPGSSVAQLSKIFGYTWKNLGFDQRAIYQTMADQGKADFVLKKQNYLLSYQTSIKIYIAGLWPRTHVVLPITIKQIILEMFFIATHLHVPREVAVQIVRWVIKCWPLGAFEIDMEYWMARNQKQPNLITDKKGFFNKILQTGSVQSYQPWWRFTTQQGITAVVPPLVQRRPGCTGGTARRPAGTVGTVLAQIRTEAGAWPLPLVEAGRN